jgi:hypothetical protein
VASPSANRACRAIESTATCRTATAEREIDLAQHRRRLEAAPARRAAAVQIGARPVRHHAAQVEPRRVQHHVVAQLLRLEVDDAVQPERRVARQRELRVDAQRVERSGGTERSGGVSGEGQRRRELRDLRQRDRPRDHVHVHRLPAGGVHRDTPTARERLGPS